MEIKNIIAIHGFMFSKPNERSLDNANIDFRPQIESLVDQPVQLYQWYSANFSIHLREIQYGLYNAAKVWGKSWLSGHLDPYSFSYKDLAPSVVPDFVRTLKDNYAKNNEKIIIIAHSLGSRIAILSAAQVPDLIDRMIIFNGAEIVDVALPIVKDFTFPVLNIADKRDDILADFGANFSGNGIHKRCIGSKGLGFGSPSNWTDIIIDDYKTITAAAKRGWTIEGDIDGFIGQFTEDHFYSYRNIGNANLIRAWLSGDDLSDLKSIYQ